MKHLTTLLYFLFLFVISNGQRTVIHQAKVREIANEKFIPLANYRNEIKKQITMNNCGIYEVKDNWQILITLEYILFSKDQRVNLHVSVNNTEIQTEIFAVSKIARSSEEPDKYISDCLTQIINQLKLKRERGH